MPTASDFERAVKNHWTTAVMQGQAHIDIRSGDLHREVGGYPDSTNHRMPVCCAVLRRLMQPEDRIMAQPPKGNGASLVVRYKLPRNHMHRTH